MADSVILLIEANSMNSNPWKSPMNAPVYWKGRFQSNTNATISCWNYPKNVPQNNRKNEKEDKGETESNLVTKKFIPLPYADIIRDIAESLALVRTPQSIKSTETNWYKSASRIIDHVKLVYDFTDAQITQYVVYHYLDAANYITKRSAFETVFNKKVFELYPEIETHVSSYFRTKIMKSKKTNLMGIYLANREDAQLLVLDDTWREGDSFEMDDFIEEYNEKYVLDKSRLNTFVGYMIQFKDQDMAFYYKNIELQRNKKGRRCERAGGKAPIVDTLNSVTNANIYNETNVDSMYSGSLCVILEMVLRGLNDKMHEGRIYYLTPEQAIRNKITDYSKPKA